jgi:hypothetical protein
MDILPRPQLRLVKANANAILHIVFDLGFVGEVGGAQIEMQIAESLVAGHAARDGEHVAGGEDLGFSDFSCEAGVCRSWELLQLHAVVAVAHLSVLDGLFVELDAFETGPAEEVM